MWLSIVPLGISLFSRPQIKTKLSSVFSISFPSFSFSLFLLLPSSSFLRPSPLSAALFSTCLLLQVSPFSEPLSEEEISVSYSVWIVRFEKKSLSPCPELPASAHLPPSYTPFLFSLSRLLLRAPPHLLSLSLPFLLSLPIPRSPPSHPQFPLRSSAQDSLSLSNLFSPYSTPSYPSDSSAPVYPFRPPRLLQFLPPPRPIFPFQCMKEEERA